MTRKDRLTPSMLRALEMLAVRPELVRRMHGIRKVRKSTMNALIQRGFARRRCHTQRMFYFITEDGRVALPQARKMLDGAQG